MDHSNTKVSYWLLAGPVLAVISLWGASWWFLHDDPNRGIFGDMFGGINALFSGLAFSALFYTLFLQRKELELQRLEIQQTRVEIRGQKEQLEAQNRTLKKQNFENSFFSLLNLQNQILREVSLTGDSTHYRGRDGFMRLYAQLQSAYQKTITEHRGKSDHDLVPLAYTRFAQKWQSEIGHYFRSLYNIIKFVKNSDVENKQFYINLVRAQLSSHEHVMLFYNCLSQFGAEKFKPLVEEFGLLEHFPENLLLAPSHKSLYSDAAYRNS